MATMAVVDTGAEVTVLSDKLFYSIPEKRRPTVRQADTSLVVAEKERKHGSRYPSPHQ